MARSKTASSMITVAISWIIVLVPLGWGVVQSVLKTLPLFLAGSDAGGP